MLGTELGAEERAVEKTVSPLKMLLGGETYYLRVLIFLLL